MSNPDIPERWLWNVWHRQAFDHSRLAATDGRHLQILFPGVSNNDEGPDFLGARIRIGPTLYCGDVEIHRTAAGWTSHKHHRDPHYNSVILHVVLTASAPDRHPVRTSSGRQLPTLVLSPLLSAPSSIQLLRPPDPADPLESTWRSCRLRAGQHDIVPWLLDLAAQRLDQRVASLHARFLAHALEACTSPAVPAVDDDPRDQMLYDQILYEGTMEGLGYAKNRDPFLALARNLPLAHLNRFGLDDRPTIMSLLFGAAGLLPSPRSIDDPESRLYLRALRRRWNDLRPFVRIPLLTPGDWLSFRLRPANFPTARIAAFCHALPTLFPPRATEQLLNLMTAPLPVGRRVRDLAGHLAVPPEGFWKDHRTFGSPSRSGAVIGRSRALEIIINTMIPLGILLSRRKGCSGSERLLLELYYDIPAPPPYRITGRLLNDIPSIGHENGRAAVVQGILQMVKCYCRPRRCTACDIGRKVGIRSSAASSSPQEKGCC